MKYCLLCKRWVEPEAKWGFGSVLIALILLGLLIIPGIIYIIWKQTHKRCPICNARRWGAPPTGELPAPPTV